MSISTDQFQVTKALLENIQAEFHAESQDI